MMPRTLNNDLPNDYLCQRIAALQARLSGEGNAALQLPPSPAPCPKRLNDTEAGITLRAVCTEVHHAHSMHSHVHTFDPERVSQLLAMLD